MRILKLTLTLYAPWCHSLKDKRMELRSLLTRLRAKFNVSACEVSAQDLHQTLVIGVAAIAAGCAQADGIAESIIRFIEGSTEAQLTGVERELL